MNFVRNYALRGFFGDSNSDDGEAVVNNQNKTFTENGTYTADAEYTGLGMVIVDVPGIDEIRPRAEEMTF